MRTIERFSDIHAMRSQIFRHANGSIPEELLSIRSTSGPPISANPRFNFRSDEAFALLILYNNWDKWCAEMSTPPQKVDTYFTSNQMGSHKFQGWSDEEIAKYNELFEWIETDHQTPHGKAREMEYLDQLKAAGGTRKWVREQPEFQQVIIRAKNNLFLNKLRQCDDDGSNADGSEVEPREYQHYR